MINFWISIPCPFLKVVIIALPLGLIALFIAKLFKGKKNG